MNKKILVGMALAFGIIIGVLVSPLNAQQNSSTAKDSTCSVGEGSAAACSGKWIYFSGNTSGVDAGAWLVRINGETGEIWYKNGKKLVLVREPE